MSKLTVDDACMKLDRRSNVCSEMFDKAIFVVTNDKSHSVVSGLLNRPKLAVLQPWQTCFDNTDSTSLRNILPRCLLEIVAVSNDSVIPGDTPCMLI